MGKGAGSQRRAVAATFRERGDAGVGTFEEPVGSPGVDGHATYLEGIGQYDLLTPEQERSLGQRIARGEEAAKLLRELRAAAQGMLPEPAPETWAFIVFHAMRELGGGPVANKALMEAIAARHPEKCPPERRAIWTAKIRWVLQDEKLFERCGVGVYRLRAPEVRELDPAVERALEEAVADGRRARDEMVAANLRLVVDIAKRYANRGVDLHDLIQEGNLGLIRAAERFDPTLNFRFSTYATHWIRQAVVNALGSHTRSLKIPSGTQRLMAEVNRAIEELQRRYGREVISVAEIAAHLGKSERLIEQALSIPRTAVSIDRPIGDDGDTSFADVLEDPDGVNPEENVAQNELRQAIALALDRLERVHPNGRQLRYVIERRFGLGNHEMAAVDEIARDLNLSPETVRELEQTALGALRGEALRTGTSNSGLTRRRYEVVDPEARATMDALREAYTPDVRSPRRRIATELADRWGSEAFGQTPSSAQAFASATDRRGEATDRPAPPPRREVGRRNAWKGVIVRALQDLGGEAHLSEIYRSICALAPDRVASTPNWRAAVRRAIQADGITFLQGGGRGTWKLAAEYA